MSEDEIYTHAIIFLEDNFKDSTARVQESEVISYISKNNIYKKNDGLDASLFMNKLNEYVFFDAYKNGQGGIYKLTKEGILFIEKKEELTRLLMKFRSIIELEPIVSTYLEEENIHISPKKFLNPLIKEGIFNYIANYYDGNINYEGAYEMTKLGEERLKNSSQGYRDSFKS